MSVSHMLRSCLLQCLSSMDLCEFGSAAVRLAILVKTMDS